MSDDGAEMSHIGVFMVVELPSEPAEMTAVRAMVKTVEAALTYWAGTDSKNMRPELDDLSAFDEGKQPDYNGTNTRNPLNEPFRFTQNIDAHPRASQHRLARQLKEGSRLDGLVKTGDLPDPSEDELYLMALVVYHNKQHREGAHDQRRTERLKEARAVRNWMAKPWSPASDEQAPLDFAEKKAVASREYGTTVAQLKRKEARALKSGRVVERV